MTVIPLISPCQWWAAWKAAGGRYQVKAGPGGDPVLLFLTPGGDDSGEIDRLAWQRDTAPNRAAIIDHKRLAPVEF